eukprot:m.113633 g.113633  ORF g.113633 m.113633 type:complete len:2195 (+) comp12801_c0_seq2:42-6626(+)
MGTLSVSIIGASDLGITDKKSKVTLYASVSYDGDSHNTKHIKKNLTPQWNETFTFQLKKPLSSSTPHVEVTVKRSKRLGSDAIGVADISLDPLFGQKEFTKQYSLSAGGRVKIKLAYDGEVDKDSIANAKKDLSTEEAANEAGKTSQSFALKKSNLNTKPQDFQVRVRVIEGRSLYGNKSLKPLVKVSLDKVSKRTRTQRGTNSPWYNEMFFFNVKKSQAELYNTECSMEVFNAQWGRDPLVGSFTLDLGLIYGQENHHVSKKWVMLTNPKNRAGGVMGFLKISMTIVGQGDNPPIESEPEQNADEDIEQNMLRPPGVTVEQIDMSIRAYRGEDMPKMDFSFKTGIKFIDKVTKQENKQDCDPFLKVQFAGHKMRTKTQNDTYFPVWMEELHIPASVPSLADKLLLRLYDDDPAIIGGGDDIIATEVLSINEISFSDPDGSLGFQPTFGPAWVNFYGSTREFSKLCSSHNLSLNMGEIEGCGFRGRCLVEILSQPGAEKLEKKSTKIEVTEQKRLTPYLNRSNRYLLEVELLDMNMLSEEVRNGHVRVEVSMGVFGTSDGPEDVVNSVSSPVMPEKDFSDQFYIAWGTCKPLLQLESEWEDVMYRYRTMNYIKNLSNMLADVVIQCNNFNAERDIEQGVYLDLVDDVTLALKNFVKILEGQETQIPTLPADNFTRLDFSLYKLRKTQLNVALSLAKGILEGIASNGPQHIQIICEEAMVVNLKNCVDSILYEPQLSIPDVIVWVLTEKKRTAYLRFPVTDIMFDDESIYSGQHFDQTQSLFMKLPKKRKGDATKANDVPAQIQFRARFGLLSQQKIWSTFCGERVQLCEVYENQRWLPGVSWTAPGRTGRFTDITRKHKRDMKAELDLPPGWEWQSDWFSAPIDVIEDPEAYVDTVVEEVWQRQRFVPVSGWSKPAFHNEYTKDRGSRLGVAKRQKAKRKKKELKKQIKEKEKRLKALRKKLKKEGRPTLAQTSTTTTTTSTIGDFLDESQGGDDTLSLDVSVLDGESVDDVEEDDENELVKTITKLKQSLKKASEDDDAAPLSDEESDIEDDDDDMDENKKAKSKSKLSKGKTVNDFDDEIDNEWEWVEDEWRVDKEEACDHEGWMYAVSFSNTFYPSYKRRYFVRKRKYIRTRRRKTPLGGGLEDSVSDDEDPDSDEENMQEISTNGVSADDDGWRYAFTFGSHLHKKRKKTDYVRTRRYRRELAQIKQSEDDDELEDIPPLTLKQKNAVYSSGVYLRYNTKENYEARIHLYQARRLLAADSSGFSDPYVVMYCGHKRTRSVTIKQSVSPLFDQVLCLPNIEIPGSNAYSTEFLPPVVLEFYDYDSIGSHDFLGRVVVDARIRTIVNRAPPKLQWYQMERHGEFAGEVLIAAELVHMREIDNIPLPHPKTVMDQCLRKRERIVPLPVDVRPELSLIRIDVFLWGVRELSKYKFLSVNQPSVSVQCGNFLVSSPKLRNKKSDPNFHNTILSIEMLLPVNRLYAPPIVIKLFDNRKFGRKPCVGTLETDVSQFLYIPKEELQEISYEDVVEIDEGVDEERHVPNYDLALREAALNDPEAQDDRVDWWSKFFASQKEQDPAELAYYGNFFQVYDRELERVFDFQDVVSSFTLLRGKEGQKETAGVLKAKISVITDVDKYEKSDTFGDVARSHETATQNTTTTVTNKKKKSKKKKTKVKNKSKEMKVLARVYVVRCIGLQPQDSDGGCDAYVQIKVGKKRVVKDSKNYIPSSLNPLIGRYFDVEMTLPRDTQITLGIWDHDTLSGDDLVGETVIDIEDRVLTKQRAMCGLPQNYVVSGFNRWRDVLKPREHLALLCEEYNLPEPQYSDDVNNAYVYVQLPHDKQRKTYACKYHDPRDDLDIKLENAALTALHAMDIVKEHIETRNIFNPNQPGISQGQVQMWIDIFPLGEKLTIPEPINIGPREPKEYELRVIVYNTYEVPLNDTGLGGQKMSDIYVKGYLRGMENKKAKTDTHYRSLNGEGNFNWRLKFKFLYIPAEQKIVVRKKRRTLSTSREDVRYPPILTLQLWDNDLFSSDDVLGFIDFNLLEMPHGFKVKKKCKAYTPAFHKNHGYQDLFKQKQVQGIFPCNPTVAKEIKEDIAGKLEIEIELLTKEEADAKENGVGRKSPNQFPKLEPPKRPPTSFFWLTSPWKAFRYIIWANYKWKILIALLILLLIAFIALVIYNAPFFIAGAPFPK